MSLGLLLSWPLVAAPPDIVLMVSDDQHPATLGFLGQTPIETPALDRLAAQGCVFHRAYAGYPICYASRAEILTGAPAFRALDPYPDSRLREGLTLLPEALAAAGYQCWYVGKWHNDGEPKTRGYHRTRAWFGSGGGKGLDLPDRGPRGHPLTGYRGWTFKDENGVPQLQWGAGLTPDISEQFGTAAVEVLAEAPRSEPLFLHLNFAAPHDPRLVPSDWQERLEDLEGFLPPNWRSVYPLDHGNRGGRDEVLLPRPLTEESLLEEWAVYLAILEHMDREIGRVLEAVKKRGRDTVVVFTSDQGLALGSHGLLGKQNCYEHSIRAPLIVAGPGVEAGRKTAALVMLRDLYPTFCDWAGAAVPESVEGRSLRGLLSGKESPIREEVFGAFKEHQRMICDSRWKYIHYPQTGERQLFDLDMDPHEMHNLAAGEVDRVQRMHARLQRWCAEQGDRVMTGRVE